MSDAIALRNRFAMVKGAWDEHLRGVPFPALGEGTAEEKIERLEIALVDEMRNRATPETAEQAADARAPPGRRRCGEDPRHPASRGARTPRPPADLRPPAGLCDSCVHQQLVRTGRGSEFSLCRRSKTEPEYPKYPRVPVLQCRGHEPRAG